MKQWLKTAIVILMTTFFLSGIASAKDWKKIRVGVEGAYPPFSFVTPEGELDGFDIEFAKALVKVVGAEIELVQSEWDSIIPGLLAKKYDCIIASMGVTEDRKKKVDFTNKYYVAPARFVAKKNSGITISKEGLKGKSIGVQRATVYEKFLVDKFGDTIKLKLYGTQDEANLDLTSGRIDLGFAEPMALSYSLLKTEKGKQLELIGPTYSDPEYFGPIAIALRKGEDNLRQIFNQGIKELRANGTYQKINAKYFSFDIYGD